MRQPKNRVGLLVEAMESRALLSALTPVLTIRPPNTAGADVGGITGTLARQVSRDSVRIQNKTGLTLEVTARLKLPGIHQPTIGPKTIPAARQPIELFDFERNANAFITIDVKQKNGVQKPPPLKDYPLGQPLSGYHGKLFSISIFGDVFSVSA
jgi:hypothetical protein